MINAARGTKDILPVESWKWQHVEATARDIFSRYGYGEIRTPIFELTELFARGVGETTDIVEKEMYTFQDKGGRSLTLRPEGTAGVVRAYVEHKLYASPQSVSYSGSRSGPLSGSYSVSGSGPQSGSGIVLPVSRLYYTGPFFRYERPQAGRFRQHYQIGAEAIGSLDPSIDAEIIGMAVHLFESLKMTGLEVRLNSIGCKSCRPSYKEILVNYFKEEEEMLCADCQGRMTRNPLRILDCKKESCKTIALNAPASVNHLCNECDNHFQTVKKYLAEMEISYFVCGDLVRGLDYYTKTVFEVVSSSLGAQSSVSGGGRYDGLVEMLGGPSKPAVGFATGIERIVMVMDATGAEFPEGAPVQLFIVPLGDEAIAWAVKASWFLRKAGFAVQIGTGGKGLSAQLKEAAVLKAKYSLILGENELANGTVILRNMKSGSQEDLPLNGWEEKLTTILVGSRVDDVEKSSLSHL